MGSTKSTEDNAELLSEEFSDYEKVYLKMSRAFSHLGKEHWGIHCICSIRYDGPTETNISVTLRNAWMQLAIEYPGLSMIPIGLRKQCSQLDEASILQYADDTFFVTGDLRPDDVVARAKPRDLPALYYLPISSEVVLLIQHWRTDGLGACMLLDRLFEILQAPIQASISLDQAEHKPLSASMEAAAGAVDAADPEIQAYAQECVEQFHRKALNASGIPFQGSATTQPLRSTHCDMTLLADDTQSITAACKSRQFSVSAAIHTALARTVFSYLPETECEIGYTTVMAVNMRHHLPSPYNSKAHACQTYVASITPTVPYRTGFVDAARTLTHEYQNWWSEKFMQSLHWIYKYNIAILSTPRPANAAPPKPPSGVTLSSLGVIERYLRGDYGPHLKIERFRFGVSMMTRQMMLYAWTFKGQLTLSLNYNEAYYSDATAQDVLSRLKTNLEKGLQVKLDKARVSQGILSAMAV